MSEEQTVVEESTDQSPLTQMLSKKPASLQRCTTKTFANLNVPGTQTATRRRLPIPRRHRSRGRQSVMDTLRDFLTSESKHAEETTMYGCQPEWLSDAKTHAGRVRSALERWEAYNRNYVPRMPVTQTEIYASLVGFKSDGGVGRRSEPAPGSTWRPTLI